MKMKKLWALLLVSLMALSVFAGCNDNPAASSKSEPGTSGSESTPAEPESKASSASEADANISDEPVTISVSNWPTSADPDKLAQFEGYLEKMKELHPNVTVVPDEYEYAVDTFLPKAASGQLPTIYSTFFTETSKIINAGYAADISSVMETYGYDTMMNQEMLDLMKADGKIYGIPNGGYNVGMLYNIELFEEAGLLDENGVPQYAQTYEELAQLAVTIKEKTGKPGLFWYTKNNQGGWMFMNLAWSYGVEFMKQDGDKWVATFDSDEAVEAMQYVKDLKWVHNCIQDNTLVAGDEMFTAFATNQVGMAYSTLDWNDPIVTAGGANKDNLSLARVPAGPGGRVSLMGGNVYMFSPTATEAEIDAAIKWLEVTGFSPNANDTTKSGLVEEYTTADTKGMPVGPLKMNVWSEGEYYNMVQEVVSDLNNVDMKFWDDFAKTDDLTISPEVPMNAQELYKAIDDITQEVLTNENADVAALMKQANETFQKDYLDNAS